jgi:hypothetical protein
VVKGPTYILANDVTTAGLIGQSAGDNEDGQTTKVYPVISTQKESLPLVTVWETARTPQRCRGKMAVDFIYQYEIHVYSLDYDELNAICNSIETALYNQDVDSGPVNGVKYRSKIETINRRDAGYVEEYKAYSKVMTCEAMVYEGSAT